MQQIPFQLTTGDSRQLMLWEGEAKPRAKVLLIHGMAEHIARYAPMAKALNHAGIAVAGFDLPGHGADTPKERLGYFAKDEGWDKLLKDVHNARELLEQRWPGIPLIMLGHSMGSFVLRSYLLSYPGPAAVIFSGTGSQPLPLIYFGKGIATLISLPRGGKKPSRLINKLAFSANNKPFAPARTAVDWLSRDEKEVDKYVQDPLCGFVFTAKGYQDFFDGLLTLSNTQRLGILDKNLPMLFISGDRDPVGGMGKGVQEAAHGYTEAGFQDVTVKLYEGARHELFNETNRDEVIKDVISWIQQRFL